MMFSSDNVSGRGERAIKLKQALKDFESADAISPNNWEIVCNFGSVYMRLGYVAKLSGRDTVAKKEFKKARHYLQDVITRIRPNYGFALYELGRVCRLDGDFASAIAWFEKALQVSDEERNIGGTSVQKEIEKARKNSADFP
jgi:tetratricopeptide (TPR) repeat protein